MYIPKEMYSQGTENQGLKEVRELGVSLLETDATTSMMPKRGKKGFTLVELLVVMSILAGLAALLVPIINSGRRIAKTATTTNLVTQIGVGMERFNETFGYYPPNAIPQNTTLKRFYVNAATGMPPTFPCPKDVLPCEALFYSLGNPYLTPHHPFIELDAKTTPDTNGNELPEIVDPWDRLLMYERSPFPPEALLRDIFPDATAPGLSDFQTGLDPGRSRYSLGFEGEGKPTIKTN